MQKIELKFSTKPRHLEAPTCPCGKKNYPNPHFAPYADQNGEYGYCHGCQVDYKPSGSSEGNDFVYVPPKKSPQKFLQEPQWNWIFQDVMIDPIPEDGLRPKGKFHVEFFYRNIDGKLTSSKRILYNFPEFKRDKSTHPMYPNTRDSGYYGCIFYERDLTLYPKATVILVESEKTAAILRHKFKKHLEEFIYLAVGGTNGLTDDKMHVLTDRRVLIVFDCDNGELQPDGTIKGPKGREAAQNTYHRLAAICHPIVIDIDPSRNDGLDLGDFHKELTIEYIRDLQDFDATEVRIPEALVTELRKLNRDGEHITDEIVQSLGKDFNINPDKIQSMYRVIQKTYQKETGISKASLVQRIEHWLSDRYEFRRNTISSQVLYRQKEEEKWHSCNSNDLWRDIHHHIDHFGKRVKIPRGDIDNILDSKFITDWNPFHHYFNNLPPWDNVDHIKTLCDHVRTEDQEFWRIQFKKALVRSIACTIDHIDNRIVMVLVGEKQSMGKSWFIRNLCPPDLAEDYYKETPLSHDKDSHIALTENFIWNLEELDDLTKKEISALKATISMSKVKERRSYARYETSMRRIVNFWGSTNKTEFLTDTENTRWLCFTVLDISHDYNNKITGTKNVDIDKVWAQAWHLYKTGFNYHLSKDEKEYQARQNKNFETMTDEKQLIMRYFRPARASESLAKFVVNIDIVETLIKHTGNSRLRIEPRNIGRAMTQLGFKSERKTIDGKTVRGYWVYALDQPAPFDTISPQKEIFQDTEEDIELPF